MEQTKGRPMTDYDKIKALTQDELRKEQEDTRNLYRDEWATPPCFVDDEPPPWMETLSKEFDDKPNIDKRWAFELGWDAALFAVYGIGREGKMARGDK